MLKKLVKYEFIATGRLMLIFYGALLLISVVNALTGTMFDLEKLSESAFLTSLLPFGISWFLYGISIAAVCVLTIIMILQRFYKNLLQNEGYLMHVLPVKTWKHIASKLVVAMAWSAASIFMIAISIIIVSDIGISGIGQMFSMMGELIRAGIGYAGAGAFMISCVLIVLIVIAAIAVSILTLYASMAIGQLADKHKILASFGAYVLINVAESIVETILVQCGLSMGSTIWSGFGSYAALNMSLLGILLLTVAETAGFFIVTEVLMRKKLNLA